MGCENVKRNHDIPCTRPRPCAPTTSKFGQKYRVGLVRDGARQTFSEICVGVAEGRVEIRDTGAGMPPDKLPELFRRFRRGEGGHGSAHTEGFGLGIAIVKRICEQTGWAIAIEHREGGGSCVRVGPI